MGKEKSGLSPTIKKEIIKQKSKKSNMLKVIYGVVLIAVVTNIIFLFGFTNTLDNKLTGIIENNEPQAGNMFILQANDCKECISIDSIKEQILKSNIEVQLEEAIDVNSEKAKELIKRFSITKLPTIIFESEKKLKSSLVRGWKQSGKKVDNAFIWETPITPYYDINTNSILGVIGAIYLTDTSCEDCYDVNMHKQILGQIGINFSAEKTIDISSEEGKEIVKKYNIAKVPTVLLSSDAKYYPQFIEVWKQVGTVEADGVYIFRKIEALGQVKFKDL